MVREKYHSTLGLRVIKKKRKRNEKGEVIGAILAVELLFFFFFFTLVTGPRRSLSLKLSDTRVYAR